MLAALPGPTDHGSPSPDPSALHTACSGPCAARCGILELSTLAIPMLAALPAVVSELASRARTFRTRPVLHVGSPTRLVTSSQALSPPRRAVCMLALCCPPQRPGALTADAGGALSCGTAAVTEPVSRALMLQSRTSSSCRQPGPGPTVTGHQALPPPRRAVCTRALSGQAQRPGALHAGALYAGGAPNVVTTWRGGLGRPRLGTDTEDFVFQEPVITPTLMRSMLPAVVLSLASWARMLRTRTHSPCWQPDPTCHGKPSPVPSTLCLCSPPTALGGAELLLEWRNILSIFFVLIQRGK
jgi:hypothetical protein